MTDPKVSVVLPTYNEEAYIVRALKSLRNQTYSDIEVIIIDDGSTDETVSLITEFENTISSFKELTVINLGPVSGTDLYTIKIIFDSRQITQKVTIN